MAFLAAIPATTGMSPFIIYALPRSRTAWLAQFLSYGGWTCHHEAAIRMRSVDDVLAFFRQPRTGTAETAAAPGWRILHHHIPALRAVVVLRPVEEVVEATLRLDVAGVAQYDAAKLRANMTRIYRSLEQIAERPGVLTVDYKKLSSAAVCRNIFEHCLPFQMPPEWERMMQSRNIQADVKSVLRYYFDNFAAVEMFKSRCKAELRRLAYAGSIKGTT